MENQEQRLMRRSEPLQQSAVRQLTQRVLHLAQRLQQPQVPQYLQTMAQSIQQFALNLLEVPEGNSEIELHEIREQLNEVARQLQLYIDQLNLDGELPLEEESRQAEQEDLEMGPVQGYDYIVHNRRGSGLLPAMVRRIVDRIATKYHALNNRNKKIVCIIIIIIVTMSVVCWIVKNNPSKW